MRSPNHRLKSQLKECCSTRSVEREVRLNAQCLNRNVLGLNLRNILGFWFEGISGRR